MNYYLNFIINSLHYLIKTIGAEVFFTTLFSGIVCISCIAILVSIFLPFSRHGITKAFELLMPMSVIVTAIFSIVEHIKDGNVFTTTLELLVFNTIVILSCYLLSALAVVINSQPNLTKREKQILGKILEKQSALNAPLEDLPKSSVFNHNFAVKNPFDNVKKVKCEKVKPTTFVTDGINTAHVKGIIERLKRYELSNEDSNNIYRLEKMCNEYKDREITNYERMQFNQLLLFSIRLLSQYSA